MDLLLQKIRDELIENANEKYKLGFQRFFKEKVKCHGVKTDIVRKIAKNNWTEIKNQEKKVVFQLCEELYKSDYMEEAAIVSIWGTNFKSIDQIEDFSIFRKWIEKYINNWAKCDGFCNHAVGDLIAKYPILVKELFSWARSNNRWLKRAAAVSLIVPAKRGDFLSEAFKISDILLTDKDDMVQKGYGWLLKEESRKHRKEVLDYVIRNKYKMPRTALRYAIELMPKNLKTRAMKK